MKRLLATWAIALCSTAWAGPARAQSLADLQLVYQETFTGENALPTTLEVNSRGLGSLFAEFTGNAGLPGLPAVVQEVRFNMANINGPVPSQAQAVATDARNLGMTPSVAVRATLESLQATTVNPALLGASVGIGFDPAGEVTNPDLALGASVTRVLFVPFFDQWTFQVDKIDAAGLTNLYNVVLPSAVQNAILAGQPFDLILRFNRATQQVIGGLVAGGTTLSSTPVVVPETTLPIVAVSSAAQVLNSDPFGMSLGANDALQVDLSQFEVHATPVTTPVPALGSRGAALLALGLFVLLAGGLTSFTKRFARRAVRTSAQH